ncbi:hypothetical protein [Achromobacter spanius]
MVATSVACEAPAVRRFCAITNRSLRVLAAFVAQASDGAEGALFQ